MSPAPLYPVLDPVRPASEMGFTAEQLSYWAGRLRALGKAGKDRFVYFNNDAGGHAPRDARTLLGLLGVAR